MSDGPPTVVRALTEAAIDGIERDMLDQTTGAARPALLRAALAVLAGVAWIRACAGRSVDNGGPKVPISLTVKVSPRRRHWTISTRHSSFDCGRPHRSPQCDGRMDALAYQFQRFLAVHPRLARVLPPLLFGCGRRSIDA